MATFTTTSPTNTGMLVATTLIFLSFYGTAIAKAPASAPVASAPGPSSSTATPVASAPGPSTATDCMTLLLGMADCLSYVQQGSNATKPDKACCPELKTLVDTNPVCLCQLLANGSDYGFQIDFGRATKLPSVCKVDTPPVSTCALLGIPVPGPIAEGPTSQGPSASSELSPGSVSPAADNNSDKASSTTTAASIVALLVGFAITFFSTIFF